METYDIKSVLRPRNDYFWQDDAFFMEIKNKSEAKHIWKYMVSLCFLKLRHFIPQLLKTFNSPNLIVNFIIISLESSCTDGRKKCEQFLKVPCPLLSSLNPSVSFFFSDHFLLEDLWIMEVWVWYSNLSNKKVVPVRETTWKTESNLKAFEFSFSSTTN